MSPRSPKKLLKARKRVPKFRRQESWRYKRISKSWRRPKGLDNKMRLEKRGVPARVKIGYRTPRRTRGVHPSGLGPVWVSNVSQLEQVGEDKIVVISSKVGARVKRAITDRAASLGLRVANPFKGEVFE